jgi:ABC-type transporter Mla MlaB component
MALHTVTVSCALIRAADLGAVDQLARQQLGAHRGGCEIRLADVDEALVALIELAGLGDVLRVEVKRQSEQRKESRRVEEEGELSDPSV